MIPGLAAAKLAGAFLKEFWLPLAIAAALIAAGLWIRGYGKEQCERCRAQVMSEMQQKLDQANARNRQLEQESRERVEVVARDYEIKLQDLDDKYRDAVRRIGVVRVCSQPARRAEVPAGSHAASIDHGASTGDGLPGQAGGPDIGPELVELTRLADKQTQQLIACQAYAASVTSSF